MRSSPVNRPKKQTGPDGRFEFRGLSTGDYSLSASKNGWARERVDPVKVSEGRNLEPVDLVLKNGATISGGVTISNGALGSITPTSTGAGGALASPSRQTFAGSVSGE